MASEDMATQVHVAADNDEKMRNLQLIMFRSCHVVYLYDVGHANIEHQWHPEKADCRDAPSLRGGPLGIDGLGRGNGFATEHCVLLQILGEHERKEGLEVKRQKCHVKC